MTLNVDPRIAALVQEARLRMGPGGLTLRDLAQRYGLTVNQVRNLRSPEGRQVGR